MSTTNTQQAATCPVNSHTEWDPLEEVIVGTPLGAYFPQWRRINEVTVDPGEWDEIEQTLGGAGVPYPDEMVQRALKAIDEFVHILEAEGVRVRHVDTAHYGAGFATPAWSVQTGFSAANPRDPFLVIGNEIIEAPMPDRGRYFEAWAYRSLFKEYLLGGAKWVAAPKPQLLDALYKADYVPPPKGAPADYVLTEFEPVFDAADFMRCGRDLFVQKSNVTNEMGILWLQRHLGDDYRIHIIESRSSQAIHIDTTFVPLAPGKVLINPEWIDVAKLPPVLKSWDILIAPQPIRNTDPLGIVSQWISLNVFMLDEERVCVDSRQEPLIKKLIDWGFKPIPLDFDAYYPFMGGVHCATLDVRRRGDLQSYF